MDRIGPASVSQRGVREEIPLSSMDVSEIVDVCVILLNHELHNIMVYTNIKRGSFSHPAGLFSFK